MSLQIQLDRISAALQLCSPGDQYALTELLQEVKSLQDECSDEDRSHLEGNLDLALEIAGRLARLESDGPTDDLTAMDSLLGKIRETLGIKGSEASENDEEEEEEGDLGDELLALFLGGCEEAVANIEGGLIELEANPDNEEMLGEIRGVIHTLKGECGVIPLPEAQKVFHEAESLLDHCSVKGVPIPVDILLSTLDWFKSFTELLSTDQKAEAPPHEHVLEAMRVGIANTSNGTDSNADSGDDSTDSQGPTAELAAEEVESAAIEVDDDTRISFPEDVMNDPTLAEFVVEARGHLEDAEAALLDIEANPEEIELVDRIFRTFHTIKGVSGFMNMAAMVALSHSTEALLDEFRKGNMTCSEDHTTLIFACCDAMSSMLDFLTGTEAPRQSLIDSLVQRTTSAAAGEDFGGKETSAQAQAPAPVQEEAVAVVAATAEIAEVEVPRNEPAAPEAAKPQAAQKAAEAPKGDTPSKPKAKKKYKLENTVKVGTMRLDALVDMVGELVIAQQMVSQDPDLSDLKNQRLTRNLTQVAKITRDLQESAMALRMVTLKSTFQKMSRLVRDVAHKSGKQVSFTTQGEDTELDRTVVEEISDPLVHLIRNSVDHGLEAPDERKASGKSHKGQVELRAYHQGGSIVIEIRDDGRGLNSPRIFQKALERGILPPETKIEDLSQNELNKLIFQPGFSTADEVTDISGRGVGMDVVRRNIEKMRGKIDISTAPGEGTTMYLRLPLTLAIIDGMIVRVGRRRYVIPTLSIEMSFRPDREHVHTLMQEGEMVDVRGMMLPIHRLKRIFELEDGHENIDDGILILIENNGERFNLLVDEIIGQQQVVIKNLGKALPQTPCISGGAILGDGRVALILDVDALISEIGQPAA